MFTVANGFPRNRAGAVSCNLESSDSASKLLNIKGIAEFFGEFKVGRRYLYADGICGPN
jgi:hypothetical protein